MSCIPHSGGCERFATDALVAYINGTEGTQYEHLLVSTNSTRRDHNRIVSTGMGHSGPAGLHNTG